MSQQFLQIIGYIIFFVWSFIRIYRNSKLAGYIYAITFLYTIFTMIGYVYAPNVAKEVGMYYGEDIWYEFYLFIILSMIFTFMLYYLLNKKKIRLYNSSIYIVDGNMTRKYYIISSIALCIFSVYLFLKFPDRYAYGSESKDNIDLAIGYVLSLLGSSGLISWMIYRSDITKNGYANKIDLLLAISSLAIFVYSRTIMGTRGVMLSLILGIIYFEHESSRSQIKLRPYKLFILGIISFISLWLLFGLTYARYSYGSPTFSQVFDSSIDVFYDIQTGAALDIIFKQDYFYPAMLLFEVIYRDYIDFKEVIVSNSANAFIFIKYPKLTATITRDILGVVDRQVGFAFHIFIEGFIAFGWFGIIYNAIVWNLGVRLWQWFATSNNIFYNQAMTALLFTQVISMIRDQSSALIKSLWLQMFPAAIILLLAMGCRFYLVRINTKG